MVALAAGAREMSMGKSKVKIGDSGEMEFKRTMANGSVDAHPVKIKMDELVQVDANGNALTDCQEPTDTTKPGMSWMNNPAKKAAMKGEMKAFRDFNNQQFAFESKLTDQAMKHGGSMKAEKQKFSASLGDGIGKMTIDLALPEEDGDIDIAGEKQRLKKGDMKFNIEMSEWNWCDNAAFLDVYMKVQGKNKPKKRFDRSSTLPASYDMGDNKTVSFSGKVRSHDRNTTSLRRLVLRTRMTLCYKALFHEALCASCAISMFPV